ncbi:unnamed protein product, partial [marine sediment metagenome]
MLTINGHEREPTGLTINGVDEFFATEGELQVNGQEHYDFFRRYGVNPSNLVLWLDQSAPAAGLSLSSWADLSGQINPIDQATASYQPSIVGSFQKDASRDFDGTDNFMAQEEQDDESGATFWPTNAGAAFNATNARFRVAGVDLSAFATAANDYMLVIHDSADKTAWGYIDVADSAEDTGSEEVGAGNCTSAGPTNYDTFDGASATGFHAIKTTAGDTDIANTADQISWVANKLYKITFTENLASGLVPKLRVTTAAGGGSIGYDKATVNGANTIYFISDTTTTGILMFYHIGGQVSEYTISNISVKEVTHVGEDGVLIMSTKGGTTQSWALQESGIDLNDIDSFEVLKTDFQITGALSVFMWVKPDDGQPEGGVEHLLSKLRAVDKFRSFSIILMTDGKIRASFSSNGADLGEYKTTDGAFFSNGAETWHHIGFVYNGTTIVIYGDGVALDSTVGVGGIPAALHDNSEKLTIGSQSTPGNYFRWTY